MCVMICLLQNVPLPHQKAKAATQKRRIERCLQHNSSKSYICSTVNVGYPRLMAQPPAHAQPTRAFRYRSPVRLTHGIPMAGLHVPDPHCIQGNFVVVFFACYFLMFCK